MSKAPKGTYVIGRPPKLTRAKVQIQSQTPGPDGKLVTKHYACWVVYAEPADVLDAVEDALMRFKEKS